MQYNWQDLLIMIPIVGNLVYLIWNILIQLRARKRLEKIIRNERTFLSQKFKEQNEIILKNIGQRSPSFIRDKEHEILLMLLRDEINKLNENTDKQVMKKTLDRKNFNNQKNYAFRIFSESGMEGVMNLNK